MPGPCLTLRQECEAGHAKLLQIAMRITGGNEEAAKDLAGDGILRALENEHLYKPGDSFFGWMFFIMRNLFYTKCAKRVQLLDCIELLPGNGATDDSALLAEVIDCLKGLPPEQARVLALWCIGYRYAEIADSLNIPIGTVKSRLFSARAFLSKAQAQV